MIKGEGKCETRLFAWRKRKWGGGVFSPPPSFKRKKISPHFGKKTREKSTEEVSLK